MPNYVTLNKSMKGRFDNYLIANDKLKFIINLALNNRFSDIYITEWKPVQYKKNGIITLEKEMLSDDNKIEPRISSNDFQDFLKSIFLDDLDMGKLSDILKQSKSFDYWIGYKFTYINHWSKKEVIEDIRLRLNFINTVEGIMLTVRPLLNIGLTYDNLTSLEWAISFWKNIVSNEEVVNKAKKEEVLDQVIKMNGVSDIIKSDFARRSGLILVTWSTWEGKSTLVTSLIEDILKNTDKHILTLEDPVEYIFNSKRWKVTQIEVGTHIESFSSWIRGSKRENPDIVYIQEIRDKASARALVELLWSWVLVITTLHTWSVVETIDRLIWLMSEDTNQEYIRTFISRQLISIINQKLIYVKHNDKVTIKWVQEYLHLSWSSRKNIVENKINQLESDLLESNPPNKSMTKLLWYFYVLEIISMSDLLQNITNIGTLEAMLRDELKYVKANDEKELSIFLWVKSINDLKS